jgi:biopolymer transport protein ExbB
MKVHRLFTGVFLIFMGAITALALEKGSDQAVSYFRVWIWFEKGGILMYPILACSLLSAAITLERLFALQRQKIIPPRFLQELQQLWNRGDMYAILPLCKKNETPLTRILEAGFRRIEIGLRETERAIEAAGQHEVSLLTSNLRLLGAVSALTPMLGLLGTVTGMIKAFENIAQSGSGNPNLVASGIAEALTTTAAGLIVAIPSLAAYHFFRGRVDRYVYEMEEIASMLLTGLVEGKPATENKETNNAVS